MAGLKWSAYFFYLSESNMDSNTAFIHTPKTGDGDGESEGITNISIDFVNNGYVVRYVYDSEEEAVEVFQHKDTSGLLDSISECLGINL